MQTSEITIKLINETLSETLDAFESELKKLERQEKKIPKERETIKSLKPLLEFTETSIRCAQFIENISLLLEDAPKLAYCHLADKQYDEFKNDKKELFAASCGSTPYGVGCTLYNSSLDFCCLLCVYG